MAIFVMFAGELCQVLKRLVIEERETKDAPGSYQILYELEKLDAAEPGHYYSVFAVKSDQFYVLPSTLGLNASEWIKGVNNGQTK